jgi:hypothetical protein
MKKAKLIVLKLLAIWLTLSCENTALNDFSLVYENDFEGAMGTEWIGAVRSSFEEDSVLGPYNNAGFKLYLEDLPKHNVLLLSFDLLIHDSWDGNLMGLGGPDYWEIKVDRLEEEAPSSAVFRTTFSNGTCDDARCLYQSYPQQYPNRFSPKTGKVLSTSLPGRCADKNSANGTSLYQMQVEFSHNTPLAIIQITDYLKQTNAEDPACDESWSLDNLKIYTLNY